ncbi:hypothetical protein LTR86_006977 [Recurvomyces mirabilis]|nr:hypothetical protein LTR86_006977 [Recurvomyces mirabilis]
MAPGIPTSSTTIDRELPSMHNAGTSERLLNDAEDVTRKEHELTFWAGIKLYPRAVAWSMTMSTTLVMDGYDFKLIGSLFAQPQFAKAYGQIQANGKYQIPAAWQTGLNNGSNVGQMIGLLIAGFIVDRLGFRKTMISALCIVPCLIFLQFFAKSLAQLEAAQVLMGKCPNAAGTMRKYPRADSAAQAFPLACSRLLPAYTQSRFYQYVSVLT